MLSLDTQLGGAGDQTSNHPVTRLYLLSHMQPLVKKVFKNKERGEGRVQHGQRRLGKMERKREGERVKTAQPLGEKGKR